MKEKEIIMKKKIAALLAAAALCVSFTGCNGESGESSSVVESSGKTAAEKAEALKAAVPFVDADNNSYESRAVSADQLTDILGVDSADVTEFAAYICPTGAIPDEFGIFVAKDADAAKRVESALTNRMNQRNNSFKDYKPNEMFKFDDCFVETDGNTVIYAVCGDNTKAKELLK